MDKTYYIIDFDSTFVKIEALDTLSEIVLQHNPDKAQIVQKIKDITNAGMNGEITFTESLERRLSLFTPSNQHIQVLIQILEQNITESVKQYREWFVENAQNIYIISGGFKEYIVPIVAEFGIRVDHVLANEFIWDHNGTIITFDSKNVLSHAEGKVIAVKSLHLSGTVVVIGDGYTDYQIKERQAANTFIAFTENIARESIIGKADTVATSFASICIK